MIPHNAVHYKKEEHYKKKIDKGNNIRPKENRQALELFVKKYFEKHEAFKYLLTTFPLAISPIEKELY